MHFKKYNAVFNELYTSYDVFSPCIIKSADNMEVYCGRY